MENWLCVRKLKTVRQTKLVQVHCTLTQTGNVGKQKIKYIVECSKDKMLYYVKKQRIIKNGRRFYIGLFCNEICYF